MNKSLWVDNKTPEDIEYFSKEDSDNVVYNLQEDISCLKETIAELEKANTLAVCSLKVGGKMNQILTAKIAELELRLNISECMVANLRSVKAENQTDFNNYTQALEVNNLRQQAKGIEDFFAWLHITQKDSVFGCSRSDLAEHFAADLKKQADELAQGDIELVKKWLADNESVGQQELEDNRVANAANTAYADAVEAAADAVNADAYADVVNAANVAAYADAADAAANAVYWIKRYEELKEQE